MTIQPTLETERELWAKGYLVVAGVDEVGRGVWAGPVVAGAVVLPDDKLDSHWVRRLRDSKVLSARAREELATEIIEACDYGIGAVDEQGVDELGIVVATRQAMRLAVLELQVRPDALIIDGNEVVDLDIVAGEGGRTLQVGRGGEHHRQGRTRPLHGRSGQGLPRLWLRGAQGLRHEAAPAGAGRARPLPGAQVLGQAGAGGAVMSMRCAYFAARGADA